MVIIRVHKGSLNPNEGAVEKTDRETEKTHTDKERAEKRKKLREMGTLVGHILPSVVFVLVGFWHLVCAFCNYVRQGREYTSKAWHAMGWFPYGLKHIELYLMVVLIPFAIFYELGVSTSFRPMVDSMIPLNRVASFEHTTTLFMFWLFAVIVLFSDTTAFLPLPAEASFLFAGLAFALEWISLAHEAARNSGLESQCNLLLAYISGLCAASAGFLALRPKTFLVDVLLCMGIILQGTWLFQIALFLYVEQFIPQGCHYRLDLPTGIDGSTLCEVEQARIRAVALINLAFNCHVIAVVVFSVLLFALVAKLQGHRRGGYDPLVVETDPEGLQMKPLPKLNSFDRRSSISTRAADANIQVFPELQPGPGLMAQGY